MKKDKEIVTKFLETTTYNELLLKSKVDVKEELTLGEEYLIKRIERKKDNNHSGLNTTCVSVNPNRVMLTRVYELREVQKV